MSLVITLLLSVLSNCVLSNVIPAATALDITNGQNFKISGTFCTGEAPNSICVDSYMILDITNGRMKMNAGIFGITVILSNASYVWEQPLQPQCLRVNNYNFTDQVNNFRDLKSLPFSFSNGFSHYQGLNQESATCKHLQGSYISILNDIWIVWSADQRIPVTLPGSSICFKSFNRFKFDISTKTIGNFDSEFKIREDCYPVNNPDDYCSTIYYTGNPCDTTDP